MKFSVAVSLAVSRVVDLAFVNYGSYMPYYPSVRTNGGLGNVGFLMMTGVLSSLCSILTVRILPAWSMSP